jgi:O-antigen ligase
MTKSSAAGPPDRLLRAILPVLLVAAIVFGGSIRGAHIASAAMQVVACLVLMWCLLDARLKPMSKPAVWLLLIGAFTIAVGTLQLLPLPFEWWSVLPGRQEVAGAFALANAGTPSQPFSLAPEQTVSALLFLLPPLAVFVLTSRLSARILDDVIGWTLISLAVSSVAFGVAQMMLKDFSWPLPLGRYPGPEASGVFSSANHQATLLLMSLPFAAAILSRVRSRATQGDAIQAEALIVLTAVGAIVFGIIAAGSVAGYAMLFPAIIAGLLIVFGGRRGFGLASAIIGSLILVGAVAYAFIDSPALSGIANTDLGSRSSIYGHTVEMIQDHLPLGAGLGAFEGLYPSYEDPAAVGRGFIISAHNDYLQIALELGLPGCLVLVAFLGWWGGMSISIWRQPPTEGKRLRQAASIAVAVVLVHSIVDSPARTPAIATLLALSCAIMSISPSQRGGRRLRQREAAEYAHRHIEI